MHNISEEYTKVMKKSVRPEPLVRISYGIINQEGEQNDKDYSSQMEWGDAELVDFSVLPSKSYLTFENKRFKTSLNNNLLIPPTNKDYLTSEHYISEEVSSQNGSFLVVPYLDVTFNEELTLYGVTLTFDSVCKTYVSELKITVYDGQGAVLEQEVESNSNYQYSHSLGYPNIKRIRFEFLKTGASFQRVRVDKLDFGIYKVFTTKELDSSGTNEHSRTIDLISNLLSQSRLTFTILNTKDEYNVLNPTGLWRYAEDYQPVKVEFGRRLDDGEQWIQADKLYLSGDIVSTSTNVTFQAVDLLTTMTDLYDRFVYRESGVSFYDLAVEILTYAGLKQGEYIIDERLNNYMTHGLCEPLPINQALQLIANASNSILFTDSVGRINIQVAYDPIITISDNGHAINSTTESIVNGKSAPTEAYATFDLDNTRVNEQTVDIMTPENKEFLKEMGYISNHIAKEDGSFEVEPKLTINYSLAIDVFQIPITFNNAKKEYATDFDVVFYDELNNEVTRAKIVDNTQVTYFLQKAAQNITKIELVIHKWSSPNHRCVVNRVGEGRINDFYLDYSTAYVDPIVNKNRPIKGLSMEYSEPFVRTGEEASVVVNHNKTLTLEVSHEPMTNMRVEVSSGLVIKEEHYAFKSYIEVDTLDIETISIIGTPIDLVVQTVFLSYNKNGIIEPISNPLIGNLDRAKSVGNWVYDYVSKSNTLTVPYRGNPELEPFDTIYLESKYDPYTAVRIKRASIKFGRGTQGEVEVVKI